VMRETTMRPPERVKLGTLLANIAREAGALSDAEHAAFTALRDTTTPAPLAFEPAAAASLNNPWHNHA